MSKKKFLIIVDPQNDFIEGGTLAVEGARKAMTSLANHVRTVGSGYDRIYVSLDTHHVTNLGFSRNWDGDLSGVTPGSPFPKDAIRGGHLYPKIPYTRDTDIQSVLDQPGFMCWPMHCIKGTPGHQVYPALEEALQGLGDKVVYLTKGEIDTKDNYSIFHYGDHSLTRHGREFNLWNPKYDDPEVYVAGLALDYCVFETIKSLQEITKGGTYYLYRSMTAGIQSDEKIMRLYDSLKEKVNIKV